MLYKRRLSFPRSMFITGSFLFLISLMSCFFIVTEIQVKATVLGFFIALLGVTFKMLQISEVR
jgi:hypothetical protein